MGAARRHRSVHARRGFGGLIGSVALLAGGVLLPLRSLVVIGSVALVASFAAFVVTRVTLGLRIERTLPLGDLVAGKSVQGVVHVTSRFAPGLVIHEQVHNAGCDRQPVVLSVAKRLRSSVTDVPFTHMPKRGRLVVGPTLYERTDPFGFVRLVRSAGNEEVRRVLPCTVPVKPADVAQATRYEVDPTDERVRSRVNDNFTGDLRAYAIGDEPRRVHWASTARTGSLVVRTEDPDRRLFRYGLTIDLVSAQADDDTFELLIEVAASIAVQMPGSASVASPSVLSSAFSGSGWFAEDVDVVVLASDAPHGRRFRNREALLNYLALADRNALQSALQSELQSSSLTDQRSDRVPQQVPQQRRALPGGLTISGTNSGTNGQSHPGRPHISGRAAARTVFCGPSAERGGLVPNELLTLEELPGLLRKLARRGAGR